MTEGALAVAGTEDLAACLPEAVLHRLPDEGHISITGHIGPILASVT